MENNLEKISKKVFELRPLIIGLFILGTLLLLWSTAQIKLDAGFEKNIPLKHEYMQTFIKHQQEFGGANRILIAIEDKSGDIYNPEFFEVLKKVTDELFFIEGVDRAQVKSLFTPNTRFIEVVEGGFAGGPVIPADFQPRPSDLELVRKNTIKAGIVGRYVSNDFSCAMVSAQLLEIDPSTGERLDYIEFAHKLEQRIRSKYETDQIKIHAIGFAKMIGDIADGAKGVFFFFLITIMITGVLVYLYCFSIKLTVLPIFCSIIGVIWQLGLLNLIGFGLDPMSILVPFLIFAIGVSHGMQMINSMGNEIAEGLAPTNAARISFTRLLIPGGVALLSDTVGFLTLLRIEIGMIQELAITASLGVAAIILTNLVLLPLLLSYLKFEANFSEKFFARADFRNKLWNHFAGFATPKKGAVAILVAILLLGFGLWKSKDLQIGDMHAGAPALHSDSVYNQDIKLITERFSIGVDAISIIVETQAEGCIKYDVMEPIDRFAWYMQNIEGVNSVISLPQVTKIINSGYNEGNAKWKILPRNVTVLSQATSRVETSSGLLNGDCSVMPVIVFTADHKAATINRVVAAVKKFNHENKFDKIKFRLATGPVGVMAATNEAVEAAQIPMLIYVYLAVFILCLISFRSILATICVILPLVVVSSLCQALMVYLEIGLTVATLPVVALGVGIGVDYGIYIINPMLGFMKAGLPLKEAYLKTLQTTGSAVLFTGFTLALGVSTWIFSMLKFQVDIGILLTFMFMLNMLGAIILIPAIAAQIWARKNN